MKDMKHFLIYTNYHKDADGEITKRIIQYLTKKGHKCNEVTDQKGL